MAQLLRDNKLTFAEVYASQLPAYAKTLAGYRGRLKEVCLEFYNAAFKVRTSISEGFPKVQKLAQLLLNDMEDDEDDDGPTIEESFKGVIQKLCFDLVCDEMKMTAAVNRMVNFTEQLNCLCAIMTSEHQLASTSFLSMNEDFVPMDTWPASRFYEEAKFITSMYRKEVTLKREIITNLWNQTTSAEIKRYVVRWKRHPSMEHCKHNLENLVIECGLKSP